MKKLFVFLLLAASLCAAQNTIRISNPGPFHILAKAASFAGSGLGSLQNQWVYSAMPNATGACIYVQNNDLINAHTVVVNAYTTPNPANFNLWSNGGWQTAPVIPSAPAPISIAANSTQGFYVPIIGAANVQIVFGGDGVVAGNGNLFVIEQTGANGCNGPAFTVTGSGDASSAFLPLHSAPFIQCDLSSSVTVAAGASGVIVAGVTNRRIYICGFVAYVETAVTTSVGQLIQTSTAQAACAGPTTIFKFGLPIAAGSVIAYGEGSGLIMKPVDNGKAVCLNNGDTGGSVTISVSYMVL